MFKIIDFKNESLGTELGAEIKGIYNSIESNLHYAILLKNIVVEGKKYNDVYTQVFQDNENYLIYVYNYCFKITPSDIVETSKILDTTEQGTYILKLEINGQGNKILKLVKEI